MNQFWFTPVWQEEQVPCCGQTLQQWTQWWITELFLSKKTFINHLWPICFVCSLEFKLIPRSFVKHSWPGREVWTLKRSHNFQFCVGIVLLVAGGKWLAVPNSLFFTPELNKDLSMLPLSQASVLFFHETFFATESGSEKTPWKCECVRSHALWGRRNARVTKGGFAP